MRHLLSFLCLLGLAIAGHAANGRDDLFTPARTLKAFPDREALAAYFEPLVAERRRLEEERLRQEAEARRREEARLAELRRQWEADNPGKPFVPPPPPARLPEAPASALAQRGASDGAEAITNTQTAGVDEGGIVKVHGKHLVVLRRGRLITIDVAQGRLAPVSAVDAFGPEVNPAGAWYDEMLLWEDTVAVIGYSYARGGTELGLFNIDGAGRLTHRATYHLRGADYYSASNYASRLIGSKLIFYTPIPITLWHDDPLARLPALRRWGSESIPGSFRALAAPTRIYRTDAPLNPRLGVTLHSIVTCDLAQPELACQASGVLGPGGRVFYVSGRAVYVWTAGSGRGGENSSAVFRLPLDGGAPSALKTDGSPVDQFSFLESEDGHLNVLVGARGSGEGMWHSHRAGGDLALLRVPVREFGDGQSAARRDHYRPLPPVAREGEVVTNRFIGDYLLYGAGPGWGQARPKSEGLLQVVSLHRPQASGLPLRHAVERIEALGRHGVAVGSDGRDLHFSSISLEGEGKAVKLAGSYVRPEASQGETRSHGFFYKAADARHGIVGLPVRGAAQPGWRQLEEGSAAMLYLRNEDLRLSEVGSLEARAGARPDDGCRASCLDWYGNARPIFLDGRVFALLGYELVEGRLLLPATGKARIVESRRIDFAPGSADYGR